MGGLSPRPSSSLCFPALGRESTRTAGRRKRWQQPQHVQRQARRHGRAAVGILCFGASRHLQPRVRGVYRRESTQSRLYLYFSSGRAGGSKARGGPPAPRWTSAGARPASSQRRPPQGAARLRTTPLARTSSDGPARARGALARHSVLGLDPGQVKAVAALLLRRPRGLRDDPQRALGDEARDQGLALLRLQGAHRIDQATAATHPRPARL